MKAFKETQPLDVALQDPESGLKVIKKNIFSLFISFQACCKL